MSSNAPPPIDPGNLFSRLFFIVCYMAILGVVRFALWGVLLVQFVLHLIGAGPNPTAQRTGRAVADYVYRVWLYLSYASNEKPFPFSGRKTAE